MFWRVTRIYASQNVQEKMKKKIISQMSVWYVKIQMVCRGSGSQRDEENETFKCAKKKVAIILIARSLQLAIALLT
jgi:hypothetical protein